MVDDVNDCLDEVFPVKESRAEGAVDKDGQSIQELLTGFVQ
jgi:hypothetical protein